MSSVYPPPAAQALAWRGGGLSSHHSILVTLSAKGGRVLFDSL